ncbi:hypothetical protein KJS94_15535 [Flavihumibacter rivuli]|uniref:hypothetical protein n=1 Tax=Flavihumibacter rivuli TaxID=2838156 RepID=UPI001BDF2D2C|nr:hypothetical protein [Flavihumibacter rivuli]ULQ56060.1 hypothetical protein KJS94_15535 [Flavihumibacter rivuli]
MKKYFIPVAVGCILLSACSKDDDVVAPTPEEPVSRTVSFRIFQGKDYSSPFYKDVNAEVKLALLKSDLSTRSLKLVWDTTISMRSILAYPSLEKPMEIIKTVDGVLASKEFVHFSFNRIYKVNNQISTNGLGQGLESGVREKQVDVAL